MGFLIPVITDTTHKKIKVTIKNEKFSHNLGFNLLHLLPYKSKENRITADAGTVSYPLLMLAS